MLLKNLKNWKIRKFVNFLFWFYNIIIVWKVCWILEYEVEEFGNMENWKFINEYFSYYFLVI